MTTIEKWNLELEGTDVCLFINDKKRLTIKINSEDEAQKYMDYVYMEYETIGVDFLYYLIGEKSPITLTKYYFRCECSIDFLRFCHYLWYAKSLNGKKHWNVGKIEFFDDLVSIETNLTYDEMQTIALNVLDGHIIVDTLTTDPNTNYDRTFKNIKEYEKLKLRCSM